MTKCVMCDSEASHGEYLFLDWGEKMGKVDTYLVAACLVHFQQVRERVVKLFGGDGGRSNRGPLVAGSIIHVIPLKGEGHKVIVWSNIRNVSSWASAGKIWKNSLLAKEGKFFFPK